eukprot:m.35030 g.35030  ORF g.35030 m.35030 type:complete len:200 (-) comp12362_c0_seq1:103-702(-)
MRPSWRMFVMALASWVTHVDCKLTHAELSSERAALAQMVRDKSQIQLLSSNNGVQLSSGFANGYTRLTTEPPFTRLQTCTDTVNRSCLQPLACFDPGYLERCYRVARSLSSLSHMLTVTLRHCQSPPSTIVDQVQDWLDWECPMLVAQDYVVEDSQLVEAAVDIRYEQAQAMAPLQQCLARLPVVAGCVLQPLTNSFNT